MLAPLAKQAICTSYVHVPEAATISAITSQVWFFFYVTSKSCEQRNKEKSDVGLVGEIVRTNRLASLRRS